MEERLQKILARAGFGSRRYCEELITSGKVTVNGQFPVLGSKADASRDTILVNGEKIPQADTPIYIALNKPRGILSDYDPNDSRKSARDLVPVEGHIFTVGRLDKNSEGLMLLTNDGILANRLTHPRYGHEKEYRVLVASCPDEKQMATWRRGVVLEDGHKTLPAEVRLIRPHGKGAWLSVILREGRKRQIREVGRMLGLPVVSLIRIRIDSLRLGKLKPGEWRYLTQEEIEDLRKAFTEKKKKNTNRGKRKQVSKRK